MPIFPFAADLDTTLKEKWKALLAGPVCKRTIYVRTCGDDANSGSLLCPMLTVQAGWARVMELAPLAVKPTRWVLDIGRGTFDLGLGGLWTGLDYFTVQGRGADRTVLHGGLPSGWLMTFVGSRNVKVRNLRLEPTGASGIDYQSVHTGEVRGVTIDPSTEYGFRAIAEGAGIVPTPGACTNIRVVDCAFLNQVPNPNPDDALEALLIADTTRAEVLNCTFSDLVEVGLGFWRAVRHARAEGCIFSGIGKGAYAGRSVYDVRFVGCDFSSVTGLHVGSLGDDEVTDVLAESIVIDDCTFKAPPATEVSGVTLYTCTDVLVTRCTFTSQLNALAIGLASQIPPFGVRVDGCTFLAGSSPDVLHPDILVQNHYESARNVVITNCCFRPSSPDHYALTVSAGRGPKEDRTADAAALWAAVDVTFDPAANHLCGDAGWTYPAVAVEFAGNFIEVIVPHTVGEACDC